MHDFKKKKKIRKILYSPVTLIILGLIFALGLKGLIGVYDKEKLSSANLKKEILESKKLAEREKTLAASLDFLKTDKGVENEIRTKFRAGKDGEKLVVLIEDKNATSSTTTTPVEKRGFWYRLFHWF